MAQLLLFLATLIGSLAIGRRFIDKEYPGFVQRVETGMATMKSELLGEIDALRRDVLGMREQLVNHRVSAAEQATTVGQLERRVTRLEDRDSTLTPRRRRDAGDA